MRNIKSLALWGLVSIALLFVAASCTTDQLQRGDQAAADVNQVGTIIRTVAESPAAAVIPAAIVHVLELVGLAASLAFGIWQKVRASGLLQQAQDLGVTLKAVADGIDRSPAQAQADTKASIMGVMLERRVYDTADAVIDDHRTAKNQVRLA